MALGKKLLPILIIVSIAAGFAGGIFYSKEQAGRLKNIPQELINQDEGKVKKIDCSDFWKAWQFLEAKYVDQGKLDYQKMVYGAIDGMVDAVGDPYTVFFEPSTNKKFQEEISGAFGGVGMELGLKNNIITVIAPIKDTPAARAGIKAGERIMKIDGKYIAGISLEEAVTLIRGRPGTRVTLTIAPPDNGDTRDITLTREIIKVPAVDWKMLESPPTGGAQNIAYVQIYGFTQNVEADFKKASEEILESDADSLIIDLRNNPGGLLNEAIAVADRFLKEGVIVSTRGRTQNLLEQFAHVEATHPNYPIVLLVNEGSASAAEIVAGALQDHGRAVLLGTKTFGKGSVQTIFELGDGAALKLTVARYYTPSGRSIQDEGVHPDIVVKSEPKEVEIKKEPKDSEGAPEDNGQAVETQDEEVIEVEEDLQKQAAIDYLRKKVGVAEPTASTSP